MEHTHTARPLAKRIAVGFSMALFGVVLASSTLGGLNAGDDLAASKIRTSPVAMRTAPVTTVAASGFVTPHASKIK
jgi:hypothetical protein